MPMSFRSILTVVANVAAIFVVIGVVSSYAQSPQTAAAAVVVEGPSTLERALPVVETPSGRHLSKGKGSPDCVPLYPTVAPGKMGMGGKMTAKEPEISPSPVSFEFLSSFYKEHFIWSGTHFLACLQSYYCSDAPSLPPSASPSAGPTAAPSAGPSAPPSASSAPTYGKGKMGGKMMKMMMMGKGY